MKKIIRRIDRVTFKGSAHPMNIFTIDLNVTKLPSYDPREINVLANKKKIRVQQRINKEELRKDLWAGTYKAIRKLKEEQDLKEILYNHDPGFLDLFENAICDYLNGQWEIAREGFVKALKIKENDGPCMNLIHLIDDFKGQPPPNWPGYRKLLEK